MMCIVYTGITEKLGQNVCGVAFEVFYLPTLTNSQNVFEFD